MKATANVVIERHLKLNQLHLTILKGDPGKVAARGKRITHTPCGAWCTDVVGIENKRMQSICQRLCSGIGGYGTVTRPYICMYAMSAFRPPVSLSVCPSVPLSLHPSAPGHSFIHSFACHHTRMPAIYVSSGSLDFLPLHSRENQQNSNSSK